MLAQNEDGSIPLGIAMSCLHIRFPTGKKVCMRNKTANESLLGKEPFVFPLGSSNICNGRFRKSNFASSYYL